MIRYVCSLLIAVQLGLTATSAATFFVATHGDDRDAGTIEEPLATINRAQELVSPGDTVFIRGGTYRVKPSQIAETRSIFVHVIRLNKSGASGSPICYYAYQNEQPTFDFTDVKPAGKRVHAFSVSGSWIHLKGIEVVGVQVTIDSHTQSICFANDGSHNVFEQLSMHDSMAIGFYGVRGRENLILNCDAYRNGTNFNMLSRTPDNARDVPGYDHLLRGNVSYGTRRLVSHLNADECQMIDNRFDPEELVDADFVSLDETQLTRPRGRDGSLPVITFLRLK